MEQRPLIPTSSSNDREDLDIEIHDPLESTQEEDPEQEITSQTTVDQILKKRQEQGYDGVYLKNYWKLLIIVATFYVIPSLQFVFLQYFNDKIQETCYFNYQCSHSAFGIHSFNNVLSNIAYMILGGGFIVFVKITRPEKYKETTVGLHRDVSLYYCMGWAVMIEGILSGIYHICPSRINFQFDTTFMTIGAGILFLTMYQKRHGTLTSGPFRAFGWMALFVFLNVISLVDMSGVGKGLFWTIVFIMLTVVSILGSAHMYYHGNYKIFDRHILSKFLRLLKNPTPTDKSRFTALFVANGINYALTLAAAFTGYYTEDTKQFPTFILGLLVLNAMMYLTYYIVMKYRYGEKVFIHAWVFIVLMLAFWISGVYFFQFKGVTNKFLSPEESKAYNKPCVIFDYFDYHDLWHFLSACGLVTLMLAVYTLDSDIKEKPRSEIHVF